jgi:hypothetical protein
MMAHQGRFCAVAVLAMNTSATAARIDGAITLHATAIISSLQLSPLQVDGSIKVAK